MHSIIKKSLLSIMCLSSITCLAQKRNVLFIGNSYTAGMPNVLQQLAQDLGDTLTYTEVSPGGSTFQGHSTDPATLNAIKQSKWDIVVLQEQSQRPSFSPGQVASDTYPYAKILVDSINSNHSCTETMFYMTWGRKNGDAANCPFYPPVCTYEGMQKRLRESYLEMAKDNKGVVSPVGAAWKVVRDSVPSIDLYQADESHPSAAGTYLTACVFYASIFHKSPEGSSYTGGLSATDAQKIQYFAKKVVIDSIGSWVQDGDYPYTGFGYNVSGNTVTFQNNSLKAAQYSWNFGDGNNSTQTAPMHTYTSNGKYAVTLTASNSCFSESKTDSVTIGPVSVTNIKNKESNIQIATLGYGKIQVTAPQHIGKDLTIYSIDGRKVKTMELQQESIIIELPAGNYIYTVSDNNSLVQKGKMSVL